MDLINVGLLFGGKSAEHEISLKSAVHIWESLDMNKYEIIPIGIDKDGKWYHEANIDRSVKPFQLNHLYEEEIVTDISQLEIDIAFPVLHGPYGEDGQVQALLEKHNIPFVGSGELSSKTCMDKDLTKQALINAGIPTCKYLAFQATAKPSFNDLKERLGLPLFIKPANMGSSVGIHMINSESEYQSALNDASKYDNKIIAEEYIMGKELECGILGSKNPQASVVAEIIPGEIFYSYDDKYSDSSKSSFLIPADINSETTAQIQKMAVDVFRALKCKGFARCDFFLKDDGTLLVNEINTIPGCTEISMFPKMWAHQGITTEKWTDILITEVLEGR